MFQQNNLEEIMQCLDALQSIPVVLQNETYRDVNSRFRAIISRINGSHEHREKLSRFTVL